MRERASKGVEGWKEERQRVSELIEGVKGRERGSERSEREDLMKVLGELEKAAANERGSVASF